VERYKGAFICPWESIPMAQTLCIHSKWMWEAVRSGYQPPPWCYDIIPTQQRPWIPKSEDNLAGGTVYGCTHVPLKQHFNGSNTLYILNMDVWSGLLRWISASTMMLWHHSHSTSDPEFPNLGTTWPVECYKGAPIWPWDSILMAQTLCVYLILMFEVVWGEYQHRLWRYGIIFTPRQVTHNT
jgi:hypothetical protein